MRLANCGGIEPLLTTGMAGKQETCLTVLLAIAVRVQIRLLSAKSAFSFNSFSSSSSTSQDTQLSSHFPTIISFFVYCSCKLPSIFFRMAAAVMQPMSSLSLDREIMPPSPVSQNFSRHGRSRHGGSVVKGKARGRGYSIVDDREVMISKALTWVLKRTIQEDEQQDEGEERLIADAEGWVDCEEVVRVSSHLSIPESNMHSWNDLISPFSKSPSPRSKLSSPLPPLKLASPSNSTTEPAHNRPIPLTTSFASIPPPKNPHLLPHPRQPSKSSLRQPPIFPNSSSTKPRTPITHLSSPQAVSSVQAANPNLHFLRSRSLKMGPRSELLATLMFRSTSISALPLSKTPRSLGRVLRVVL